MTVTMVKLLQINLHHCKLASSCLASHLAKQKQDMILIQEPWIDGKFNICGLNIKGYKLVFKKGSYKPRTCILINDSINFFLVDSLSNGDLTALVIERGSGNPLCIASVYLYHLTKKCSQTQVWKS